jgi:hypothetical protein
VTQITPSLALKSAGNALQLIDTSNNNVVASCNLPFSTTIQPSFDDGVAVVAGTSIVAFNVSIVAPFSFTARVNLLPQSPANTVFINGRRIVSGHQGKTCKKKGTQNLFFKFRRKDLCVRVWDLEAPEKCLYALLGGSLRARPDNPPHPNKPGCCALLVDTTRIVAAFGAVVKCFTLVGEDE